MAAVLVEYGWFDALELLLEVLEGVFQVAFGLLPGLDTLLELLNLLGGAQGLMRRRSVRESELSGLAFEVSDALLAFGLEVLELLILEAMVGLCVLVGLLGLVVVVSGLVGLLLDFLLFALFFVDVLFDFLEGIKCREPLLKVFEACLEGGLLLLLSLELGLELLAFVEMVLKLGFALLEVLLEGFGFVLGLCGLLMGCFELLELLGKVIGNLPDPLLEGGDVALVLLVGKLGVLVLEVGVLDALLGVLVVLLSHLIALVGDKVLVGLSDLRVFGGPAYGAGAIGFLAEGLSQTCGLAAYPAGFGVVELGSALIEVLECLVEGLLVFGALVLDFILLILKFLEGLDVLILLRVLLEL